MNPDPQWDWYDLREIDRLMGKLLADGWTSGQACNLSNGLIIPKRLTDRHTETPGR